MNKLSKKIGMLALAGMFFIGGFAVVGVQANASEYYVADHEEVTSTYLNPYIDMIDGMLEELGGSHKLHEVYSSEHDIREQFNVGVASTFNRLLKYIPGANNEKRLKNYLERFTFRDGFDAFAIKFEGMYYLFVRK